MRATFGPEQLIVREISPALSFSAYRIVRSDEPDDPLFLNSFRSNYELSREPRKVERRATVIHMGVSMYLKPEVAHGTARRFAKLGNYVATLDMRAGLGINAAETGHPLHLTVWGDPIKLAQIVIDIRPVEH
jgi:hypothetical protein